MGKAAIYNPYLDTLGGGERYTLTFAKVLAEEGFDVDIEWNNSNIKEKLAQRFGLKLPNNINVVDSVNRGENYDLIFYVSDGSIPTLRSSKNYLHFQVPFQNVGGKSLLNKMKLFRIDKCLCNSKFTKKFIDAEYGIESDILYPPVATDVYKPKRKLNQICYVGRFSNLTQNKGHDILIQQFGKLTKNKLFKDWKLILAGGVEIGSDVYLKKLKAKAKGLNIEFLESPSVDQLKNVFGESKIYWSASGYGVDEFKNPEKTEHFGITVIEAMSAGCVPVIYNAGGHKEIIDDKVNGYLWNKTSDLIDITKSLVSKSGIITSVSKEAVSSSKKFGYQEFKKSVLQLLK